MPGDNSFRPFGGNTKLPLPVPEDHGPITVSKGLVWRLAFAIKCN
jgi:hypothetical protein